MYGGNTLPASEGIQQVTVSLSSDTSTLYVFSSSPSTSIHASKPFRCSIEQMIRDQEPITVKKDVSKGSSRAHSSFGSKSGVKDCRVCSIIYFHIIQKNRRQTTKDEKTNRCEKSKGLTTWTEKETGTENDKMDMTRNARCDDTSTNFRGRYDTDI